MDSHLLPWIFRVENHLKNLSENSSSSENSYVYVSPPPEGLEQEFNQLLTSEAVEFLVELVKKFNSRINNLYTERLGRKAELLKQSRIPRFTTSPGTWQVAPVSERLQNRRLDLGDVSPSNLDHFKAAIRANVQGIQVDFDDGHCPTWYNQIAGLHNVFKAVHNLLDDVPEPSGMPVLVLRPRAWNMLENNVSINGQQVPGPLFDFALLMYHNGKALEDLGCGPCFYLSKLESHREARLWNDIFSWSEARLNINQGSIKACVLIENILSCFEMDKILFELRNHSLGLNCGIWDYAASIIAKFGTDKSFLLPDRQKYIDMNKKFLKKYMQLVVKTCHRRGAHATGGMSAAVLPSDPASKEYKAIVSSVWHAKKMEIHQGVDGFMVYDVRLVPAMNLLWKQNCGSQLNQINFIPSGKIIQENDLLELPRGGVTEQGLQHNIRVTILFIYHWFNGQGHFCLGNCVEDSATAEISRSQIWQWLRHSAALEDSENCVTRELVNLHTMHVLKDLEENFNYASKNLLLVATDLFFDLVFQRDIPDFITTYIYNQYPFRKMHSRL